MALTIRKNVFFFLNSDPLNRNAVFHLITDVTKCFKPLLSNSHEQSQFIQKRFFFIFKNHQNEISKKLSYF